MTRYKTKLQRYMDNMYKYKVKCECGHVLYMSPKHPKQLCKWCGKMNFLYKRDEFKNILKNALKK